MFLKKFSVIARDFSLSLWERATLESPRHERVRVRVFSNPPHLSPLPIGERRSICNDRFLYVVSAAVLFFICPGCSSEYNLATKQQETLIYDADKEVDLGAKVARQIEKHYKINTDVDVNERVEKILKRIVAVCDRKDIVYFIKVINEDYMNAASLPGGYVYVFQGLLDKIDNDDQLAGVIAHEVGHINARHAVKQIQNA